MKKWVAVRLNTVLGMNEVYGSFTSNRKAKNYVAKQKDPSEWYVRPLRPVTK